MTSVPATTYAKSGDVHIAYQVVGDGPNDLVLVPGCVSHVSGTVKDLVAGSGITFVERGTHTLKGIPGAWPLYAVASA
jgi:hypothetical protein